MLACYDRIRDRPYQAAHKGQVESNFRRPARLEISFEAETPPVIAGDDDRPDEDEELLPLSHGGIRLAAVAERPASPGSSS